MITSPSPGRGSATSETRTSPGPWKTAARMAGIIRRTGEPDKGECVMAAITCERHEAVALITINRPEAMNALDFAANDELIEVWKRVRDDAAIRAAVITGAGDRAFCSGADLKTYTMNFAKRPGHEFRTRFTDGPGFGGITRGLDVG